MNLLPRISFPPTRLALFFLTLISLNILSSTYAIFFLLILLLWERPSFYQIRKPFFRCRWMFLIFFINYLITTPGVQIYPNIYYSPTWESFYLIKQTYQNLGIVLLSYSLWMQQLLPHELISSLWKIMHPLQVFKLPVEKAIVRLGLTLIALEKPENYAQYKSEGVFTLNEDPWPISHILGIFLWGIILLFYKIGDYC